MKPPTRCLTRGLAPQDIEACLKAYAPVSLTQPPLQVNAITEQLLPRRVQDVLDELHHLPSDYADAKAAGPGECRVVLILAQEQDTVMTVLNRFKSVLPSPSDVIFAMVTETALTWTFDYYLQHLAQEHEYMKTHRPEDDPDMKPM